MIIIIVMYKEKIFKIIERASEDEARDLYKLIMILKEGRSPWPKDPAEEYHEKSKHSRVRIFFSPRRIFRGPEPPLIKRYHGAKRIKLPDPEDCIKSASMLVYEAIRKRRSIRDYRSNYFINIKDLSALLYLSVGITERRWGYPFRAYPSAGALQPVEVYPIIWNVKDMESGIYHYEPEEHSLELIKYGDYSKKLADACLEQDFIAEASLAFVLTVYYARTKWKYGDRAYRYVHLDAGLAAENIYIVATSLGLGTCAVGAFYDDEVNELIGIDGKNEFTVLVMPLGKPL